MYSQADPRFGMSIRETFSNTLLFPVTNEYDKGAVMQISTVIWHVYHVACRRVLWDFLDIYLTTFTVSLILELKKLWGSYFSSKGAKFDIDFKNRGKNWEKLFSFSDNCISIGIVKLSLLRTGYFSSAANVLTSSPKIWHVNKRDFFQLNFLGSDRWIW